MKLAYLIIIVFLSSNAFSDEKNNSFFYINSDKLIIQDNLFMSEFIGNVYARNGVNHFWGDKILINYDNNKKIKIITIIGNVKIKRFNEEVVGDKAVYSLESEKIKINGNVTVIKDGNIINGNELLVDLINSTSTIKGNVDKQVSAKVIE
jgi:lipopolysaccharide transport protein LptA|tara:strand:+ start:205 stop:654 length:450 start_codon:yes stop_codon:yes gene_type:complete